MLLTGDPYPIPQRSKRMSDDARIDRLEKEVRDLATLYLGYAALTTHSDPEGSNQLCPDLKESRPFINAIKT